MLLIDRRVRREPSGSRNRASRSVQPSVYTENRGHPSTGRRRSKMPKTPSCWRNSAAKNPLYLVARRIWKNFWIMSDQATIENMPRMTMITLASGVALFQMKPRSVPLWAEASIPSERVMSAGRSIVSRRTATDDVSERKTNATSFHGFPPRRNPRPA
ncbi:MAG: hypothetical protein EBU81_07620 [Proteobacteria bacterium]|nr:hypothetical protein [Pseudomonadota bacterium]